MKTGLVLEGGGMRGMYTIGVLDRFLNAEISFDYVIGVSAGACNGVSFVARQRGRNYRINTKYATDKRYISLSNLMSERSLFGMKFLFETVPDELVPFDSVSYTHLRQLEEDLLWLGLDWDEGGLSPAGACSSCDVQKEAARPGDGLSPVGGFSSYCQSERSAIYQNFFRILQEREPVSYTHLHGAARLPFILHHFNALCQ